MKLKLLYEDIKLLIKLIVDKKPIIEGINEHFDKTIDLSDFYKKVEIRPEKFKIFLWDFSKTNKFLIDDLSDDTGHYILAEKIGDKSRTYYDIAEESIRGWFYPDQKPKQIYFHQYMKNNKLMNPSKYVIKYVSNKIKAIKNADIILVKGYYELV